MKTKQTIVKTTIGILWISFLVIFLGTLLTGHASGQVIYETNSVSGTIGKYNLDGTPINTSLVSGLSNPDSIAVSGSDLFVVNQGSGTIGKYDATTGATVNASLVSGLHNPISVVVFGSNLLVGYVIGNSNSAVGEYNAMTGATINASFIPGLSGNVGLALSGSNLFVTNTYSTIGEYDANTGAAINASLISGLTDPGAMAVSGSNLWVVNEWADNNNHGFYPIGEYDTTTGAAVNASLLYPNSPTGIAEYGGSLFVGDTDDGRIGEYNAMTGAAINPSVITGVSGLGGIVVVAEAAPTPTPTPTSTSTPSPTPSGCNLSVSQLKQFTGSPACDPTGQVIKTGAWGGCLYAFHTDVAGTIGRKGCALTSLSMALISAAVPQVPDCGSDIICSGKPLIKNNPGTLNTFMARSPILQDYTFGYTGDDNNNVSFDVATRDVGVHTGNPLLYFDDFTYGRLASTTFPTSPDGATGALDTLLCKGHPVIVRVTGSDRIFGHHKVLVIGNAPGGDYMINDPAARYTLLSQYTPPSGKPPWFDLIGFVTDPPEDVSGIDIVTGTNADILVQDSAGRVTGINPNTGMELSQIPQSTHLVDATDDELTGEPPTGSMHLVNIFEPTTGTYQVTVTGLQSGTYIVATNVYSTDGSPQPPIIIKGVSSPGSISTFQLQVASSPGSRSFLSNSVIVLDPAGQNALQMSGGATLQLSKGLVFVNSNSGSAVSISGGSSGITTNAIDIAGNYQATGGSSANLHPMPLTGVLPTPDPLAGLAEPSTSGLPTFAGGVIAKNTTLQPGAYQNQVVVKGGATVQLNPGIYIFKNGISVSSSTIQGSGVTLYNQGTMTFSGGSMIKLTPPITGPYAGVTVFQARGDINAATLSGASSSVLAGSFYFPNAQLILSGGSNVKLGSLVAWRLSLSGGAFTSP